MLVYYGFMAPLRGPPQLLAVDHHEYRAVEADAGDGDLYDEFSQVRALYSGYHEPARHSSGAVPLCSCCIMRDA